MTGARGAAAPSGRSVGARVRQARPAGRRAGSRPSDPALPPGGQTPPPGDRDAGSSHLVSPVVPHARSRQQWSPPAPSRSVTPPRGAGPPCPGWDYKGLALDAEPPAATPLTVADGIRLLGRATAADPATRGICDDENGPAPCHRFAPRASYSP